MGFDDDDEAYRRRLAGTTETPVEVEVQLTVRGWAGSTPPKAAVSARFPDHEVATVNGRVLRTSDKGLRIRFDHRGVVRRIWFPRSQVERGVDIEEGDEDLFRIKRWIFAKKIAEPAEYDDMSLEEKAEAVAAVKRFESGPRSPLPPMPTRIVPPAPPGRLDASDDEYVMARAFPAHVANDWHPAEHRADSDPNPGSFLKAWDERAREARLRAEAKATGSPVEPEGDLDHEFVASLFADVPLVKTAGPVVDGENDPDEEWECDP